MNKKAYKNGITMLVLIVIIMVALILTSTVIVSYSSFKTNAKKRAFANELITISKQIEQYKLMNSSYPIVLGEEGEVNKQDISQELLNEINDDYKLYKIQIEKLDIENLARGKGDKDSLDFYAYCQENNTVYYIQGEKIGGITYYYYNQQLYDLMKGKKE